MRYSPITEDITLVKIERNNAFEISQDILENEPPSPESPMLMTEWIGKLDLEMS